MSRTSIQGFILSLTILLFGVGLVGYLTYAVLEQGDLLLAQVAAVETEQQEKVSYLAISRTAEQSESNRQTLNSYFLTRESDSITLLTEVENIAPQFGIDLETTELEEFGGDETEGINISFRFEGSEAAVKEFLLLLENLPYASQVSEVKLSERAAGVWQAETIMKVKVYESNQ